MGVYLTLCAGPKPRALPQLLSLLPQTQKCLPHTSHSNYIAGPELEHSSNTRSHSAEERLLLPITELI